MSVTERTILIRPRDPLLARTAKPFAAEPGAMAETLPWPLPTTTAGALRTHMVGTAPSFTDWADPEMTARAKQTKVCGPLLLARREPDAPWAAYVPAPLDALAIDGSGTADPKPDLAVSALRPLDEARWQARQAAGEGCNLPHPNLVPVRATHEGQTRRLGAFWAIGDAIAWLTSAADRHHLRHAPIDVPINVRTHVAIDRATQTNVAGKLFSTSGLVFPDDPRPTSTFAGWEREGAPALAIGCRVTSAVRDWVKAPAFITLGGERRLAGLEFPERGPDDPWPCFDAESALARALTGAEFLRLHLVTPALFGRTRPVTADGTGPRHEHAWLPGWLDPETLSGLPDGMEDLGPLRFRLVAATIGRRVSVSGWSIRRHAGRAARAAVPAGSVYFFRVDGGPLPAAAVKRLWLRSIADEPQDRQDGFGLVLPGLWQPTA